MRAPETVVALVVAAALVFTAETALGRAGRSTRDWRKMRWFWTLGALCVPFIALPGFAWHLISALRTRHKAYP